MCNKCRLSHLIANGTIPTPDVRVSPGEAAEHLFELVDRNAVPDDADASNVSFTADLELLTLEELMIYGAEAQLLQQYFDWTERRVIKVLADRAVAAHPEGLIDFEEKKGEGIPDELKDLLRELGMDDV